MEYSRRVKYKEVGGLRGGGASTGGYMAVGWATRAGDFIAAVGGSRGWHIRAGGSITRTGEGVYSSSRRSVGWRWGRVTRWGKVPMAAPFFCPFFQIWGIIFNSLKNLKESLHIRGKQGGKSDTESNISTFSLSLDGIQNGIQNDFKSFQVISTLLENSRKFIFQPIFASLFLLLVDVIGVISEKLRESEFTAMDRWQEPMARTDVKVGKESRDSPSIARNLLVEKSLKITPERNAFYFEVGLETASEFESRPTIGRQWRSCH